MKETNQREKWVKVKDDEGNDFICPLSDLKNPAEAAEKELENCVDSGTVGRYAGNITVAG